MKKLTWSQFVELCNDMRVVIKNDDDEELVRDADEFGVDLFNIDTAKAYYVPSDLNQEIDVDGSDITLITEDCAYILSVFEIKPYNFITNV